MGKPAQSLVITMEVITMMQIVFHPKDGRDNNRETWMKSGIPSAAEGTW